MDISSASQLLSGINNSQGNQNNQGQGNSAIPGMPPATPPSVGDLVGTDFGAAGTYQPGVQPNEPEVYTPDMEKANKLWAMHEERVESFRRMVETLLGQQAEKQGLAEGWRFKDLKNFDFDKMEIPEDVRAEAQAMIEEGGYFSVDETAARLLNFAVALTGGDPSKIDLMRDAVQRGFDEAEKMFGGELPEITHETHAAVMNGFDEWAAAGSASAITLLNK